MNDFLDRWAQSDSANAKLVAQEALILQTTEALGAALERAKISKSELAERLGVTKGHVSQVFSGSRNMTLRTLADICFVLDLKPGFVVTSETQRAGARSAAAKNDAPPRRRPSPAKKKKATGA